MMPETPDKDDAIERKARLSAQVAKRIGPLLEGNPPEVQGAALADVTMDWILQHHPDDRAQVFHDHVRAIVEMVRIAIEAGYDPWRESEGQTKQ